MSDYNSANSKILRELVDLSQSKVHIEHVLKTTVLELKPYFDVIFVIKAREVNRIGNLAVDVYPLNQEVLLRFIFIDSFDLQFSVIQFNHELLFYDKIMD